MDSSDSTRTTPAVSSSWTVTATLADPGGAAIGAGGRGRRMGERHGFDVVIVVIERAHRHGLRQRPVAIARAGARAVPPGGEEERRLVPGLVRVGVHRHGPRIVIRHRHRHIRVAGTRVERHLVRVGEARPLGESEGLRVDGDGGRMRHEG